MPKLCEFENCRNRANYGYRYMSMERCHEHREDRKVCSQVCLCGEGKPEYGLYVAEYCHKCRKEGMLYVAKLQCECGNAAKFNYRGRIPEFCADCMKPGMTCSRPQRNCKCGKGAMYNYPGEKSEYCEHCKLPGMVEYAPNMACKCGKLALYNYDGESALYCGGCKLLGMVNMVKKRCKNCSDWPDFGYANKNFSNYCSRCFQRLFPDDPRTFAIRSKTKEIAVRDYINLHFGGFSHEKPLYTGGCDCTHRRRIDHWKLIGGTMLVIETDENQHRSYDKEDERNRYNDLYMVHSGNWIFIRFNPDKYRLKGSVVNPMISTRLPILRGMIAKQIKRIESGENTELVEIIYMYYDEK